MREPIFTEYRRDLLARTAFDLLKIFVATALASKFFFEFTGVVRIGLTLATVMVGVFGFLICPRKPPKKEE